MLAMLLTIKYVDGLPPHRFEKVLGRNGVDIQRQTLARWIIKCCDFNIQLDQRSQFVDAFSEVDQLGVQIHFSTLASGRIMVTAPLTPHPTPTAEAGARTVFQHHQPSHPPYRDLLLMT